MTMTDRDGLFDANNNMDIFIGIDVGTQGTKAIAYRPASTTSSGSSTKRGGILGRASASYSLLTTDIAGCAEQDPNDWINAVRFVLKTLVTDLGLVVAPSSSSTSKQQQNVLSGIGISGQQHGMVLLDSNNQPLRPAKLWCDVEASGEFNWIRTEAASAIDSAGKWDHVLPGFTSPKVLWTIKNEPDIWDQVRWCVLPHDYVNLVLRGVYDDGYSPNKHEEIIIPTTDRGDASGSGIFDPIRNQYCMELVNTIDPSGRYAKSLPQILEPLDICGSLSMQWMKDIGLLVDANPSETSNIPYIPISAGGGDNMCSALGVGCVEPGMAVLSLGTSGTIFGVSHSPPSSQVAPFADACGRYLPLVCVMSCTGVLNSVLDSFFNGAAGNEDNSSSSEDAESQKKRWTHDDATEMAMHHPPGCHGITFLPYLTPGERTPDWPHASGAILGLTASNMALAVTNPTIDSISCDKDTPPVNPMAGLLYRAAMEGITYLLAEGVSTMKQACGDGFQPNCLLVVGGGSHNQLWRQMLADVLGMELRFPKESDSAALGAAFQAGAAVDAASSNEGKEKLTMEEYILRQSIEMEEEVVRPTSDGKTLQLYQEGREQYRVYSAKLFGNSER
eukprot:CAMPEP_0201951052 /NCGR_PEP_ID=MMETSP0903-20130614/56804_1 /ASSEMBLY_ACC=CAM_ASM_000552 /TAXON_ID=420261 /ORGANISM="Thalassiosira antarctica, Strain CCMP982" /LENGTH=616 /DNA_ID=CAMNT_0048494309 /DNA_START=28 /DNA_END=1875 /DNA_ORIENTATION=-